MRFRNAHARASLFVAALLVSVATGQGQVPVLTEVGRWPEGPCKTVALDESGRLFVGNGSAVDILDVSDRSHPVRIGRVLLPALPVDMVAKNNLLYVLTNAAGLCLYDVSNPDKPVQRGVYDIGDVPAALTLSGTHIYAGYADYDVAIIDVSDPDSPTEVGQYSVAGSPQGLFVRGDTLYAACDWGGLAVADVSEPSDPKHLGDISTLESAWDVYVQGRYAYVADLTGIEVVDVSRPDSLKRVKRLHVDGAVVRITGDGSTRIYAACGDGGIKEFDISDPADIHASRLLTGVAAWDLALDGRQVFVASAGQGMHSVEFAYQDTVFVAGRYPTAHLSRAVSASGQFVFVANGANGCTVLNRQLEPVSSLDTPGHAKGVVAAFPLAFVADGPGGVRKLDFSSLSTPRELACYYPEGSEVFDVALAGRRVVAACGYGGLHVVDATALETLPLLGYWSLADRRIVSVEVRGQTAYAAAEEAGIVILDISRPDSMRSVGQFKRSYIYSVAVALAGRHALVSDSDNLLVVDVADSTQPALLGELDTGNTVLDLEAMWPYALVANSYDGLEVVDVSDPTHPRSVSQLPSYGDAAVDLCLAGDTVYVACGAAGVVAYARTRTSVSASQGLVPTTFGLGPVYPNPFNAATVIPYVLGEPCRVELKVIDLQGREVVTLVDGMQEAGHHRVRFLAPGLPSGVYLATIRAGSYRTTQKMILLR